MADSFLNTTGLGYYHNRIKALFASQDDLDALQGEVDDLITEGGEPNVIETVKVNGTALVPDSGKAVNVAVPTAVSDLANDGDGDSPFATEGYVGANGGKIDTISVNGTQQAITNKNVNIPVPTTVAQLSDAGSYALAADVPTAVSDLSNDSGYQTAADVSAAISTAVSSAYRYKGSVASQSALPATGNATGDVWDTQDTGMNYAWNGSAWDALGTYVDMSLYWAKGELTAITTAQVDALFV